jgi:hypothetical protein
MPSASPPPELTFSVGVFRTRHFCDNGPSSGSEGFGQRCSKAPLAGLTMSEYLLRFVIGGIAVSIFSMLGDVFRPKSFAGLFSAAPSVALATLAIAFWSHGPRYASIEGRSMTIGALALCIYCLIVAHLLKREQTHAAWAAPLALIAWFACAFGLKWLVLV